MRPITTLEEMQSIEMGIMKDIHNFCEEKGLRYCLAYGTLIGAVRHDGFIPWDDDIDIFMFRDDYERFIREFPEYGKDRHLYIAASDTKPRLSRNFIKVCNDLTLIREKQFEYQDDYGVFVDIWPLDGTPKNKLVKKLFGAVMLTAHRLFYAGIEKDEYFTGTGVKRLMRRISKMIGPLNILKFEEKWAGRYPVGNGTTIECYAAAIYNTSREAYGEMILHRFEDAEFYIPAGYDEILRKTYGDYMQLPPEEERKPHHIVETYWIE